MPGAGEKPVAGIDYPGTYQEFRDWFLDNASCLEYLGRLRLPVGFSCPVCACQDWWPTAQGLWTCAQCGRKTSATAGTIPHRSHTSLQDVVRGDLVRDVAEERHLGIGATGRPGLRLAEADSLMCGKAWSTLGWAVLAPGT